MNKKASIEMNYLIKFIIVIAVVFILFMMLNRTQQKSDENTTQIQDDAINKLADGACEFPGLGQKCMHECKDGYVSGGSGECSLKTDTCCKKEGSKK